ncbi:MAG: metal ABC transporter substrate-binding protein [Vulcanococcus sp.]|jgi:ABC-type Zn uptake system ZnuABC Zn-binding protein ZnuA
MRRFAAASTAALALGTIQACSQSQTVDVIAADGALCDITRRLSGADLNVVCLLSAQDDPHQLQLTPVQTRQLNQARLVLINGYGLTPALEELDKGLKVAELAVPESPNLKDQSHHGHAAAAETGHHHADRDPHVWHDPSQAEAMLKLVSQQLQQLKPEAGPQIQQRAAAMSRNLQALDRWNREQFDTISGPRVLASSHRAFASLARAYQLQELPVVDASSSSEALRPQALASVVNALKQRGVRSLFAEQAPPSRALQRISSLSGVPLAPKPLQADSGGNNLINTLTSNTCLIVDGLGGRCNEASRAALVRAWSSIR